jgi:phospho-N-acetylmuramoyl-pentapeptide-transferase
MLLELALWLGQDIRGFNVFGYITLRTVLGALTALAISLIAGPAVIRWLAAKKIGQAVRDDGPKSHLTKAGTPTMGGALILIAIGVTILLWGDLKNAYVWVTLLVTLGFGAVGWVDDWRKVVHRDPKGLASRWKYFWTSAIALAAAIYLGVTADAAGRNRTDRALLQGDCVPAGHLRFHRADLLRHQRHQPRGEPHRRPRRPGDHADGDGGRALAIFAYVAGHVGFSKYLGVPYIPGAGELAVFCGAICGAGWASCGSTPTRRRSSWATSARSRSAPRSARSR